MEHRWGTRIAVDIPVRLIVSRLALLQSGRLANVSVSGGLIRTEGELRLLSRIEVALDAPPRSEYESPIIAAYVARNCANGIAVEWCEFAPSVILLLLRHVRAVVCASHPAMIGPDTLEVRRDSTSG
jgi:hypothetical protein